jgi:hypothetical protein
MSKILLVLSLLVLASCNPSETPTDSVGDQKFFEPLTNYEDNDRVKVICNALSAKEGQLGVLISSARQYTYTFAQKSCEGTSLPVAKDVPVKIARNGSNYFFVPKNGEAFGFSNVETTDDGVMRAICNFGGTLESPVRPSPSSQTAVWWTTFTDSTHCEPGFGTLCIHLQTGSSKDGYNYKIHTNEWIKFKVLDENEGFFIERKLISSAGCAKNKNVEMRAKLK